MAVTFTLGKDAVLSGITNEIRNVTATVEGTQIDATSRGSTGRKYKSGFKDETIEVEVLDAPPAVKTAVEIDHPNSGISGTFFVQNSAKGEPLEDLVTWNVTLKRGVPAPS
jgi:hypothetical protein